MMGRILGNNPDIFTFNELHFWGKQYEPKNNNINLLNLTKSKELFAKLLCIQREGYFAPCKDNTKYMQESLSIVTHFERSPEEIYLDFLAYETKNNNKVIACEQTPRNLYYLNEIIKLPANIKIINMIRDPRDVLLSQKTKWKRKFLGAKKIPFRESFRSWVNYHPITMALLWKSAINEIEKYRKDHSIKSIKFETMLEQPKKVLQNVTTFVNINYSDNMLDIPQAGSSGLHDSNTTGINKTRLNPWKNIRRINKTEIYLCEKICSNQMKNMGYELSNYKPSIIWLIYLLIIFPIKMFFSMLINLGRYKNIKTAIRQRFKNLH